MTDLAVAVGKVFHIPWEDGCTIMRALDRQSNTALVEEATEYDNFEDGDVFDNGYTAWTLLHYPYECSVIHQKYLDGSYDEDHDAGTFIVT